MARRKLSKQEQLKRELAKLKKLEDNIKKLQEEANVEFSHKIMEHIDVILELVPEHDYDICSDGDRARVHACTRCTLLEAKENEKWDLEDVLLVKLDVYTEEELKSMIEQSQIATSTVYNDSVGIAQPIPKPIPAPPREDRAAGIPSKFADKLAARGDKVNYVQMDESSAGLPDDWPTS